MCARDVERGVADRDRLGSGPVAGTLAREVEELDAILAFAAEGALPGREEFGRPEPAHPRLTDRGRITGEGLAVPVGVRRFARLSSQLALASVRCSVCFQR